MDRSTRGRAACAAVFLCVFCGQVHGREPVRVAAGEQNRPLKMSDDYKPSPSEKAVLMCSEVGDKSPINQRAAQCKAAIDYLRKGSDLISVTGLVDALVSRCWVYVLLGDAQSAQADCTEASKMEDAVERQYGALSEKSRAHAVFAVNGALHALKKEYQEALQSENDAVDAIDRPAPGFAYIFSNRALTKSSLGEYDGALADWNQAIRLDKQYMPAYLDRGLEYQRRGDIAHAKDDFSKVLDLPAANFDFGREKLETAQQHLKDLSK